jgi:hypothetical protein
MSTPSIETSAPKTLSVPVNLTVPAMTVLGWMSVLEVMIAAESDMGHPAIAKQFLQIRDAMGRLFPPELRMNEDRE